MAWTDTQEESLQEFLCEKGYGELPDFLTKYNNLMPQIKNFFLEWMPIPGHSTPITNNPSKDTKNAKTWFYGFRDNLKNDIKFRSDLKRKYTETVKNKQVKETQHDLQSIEIQLTEAKKEISRLRNTVDNSKSKIKQLEKIEIQYDQQKNEIEFYRNLMTQTFKSP